MLALQTDSMRCLLLLALPPAAAVLAQARNPVPSHQAYDARHQDMNPEPPSELMIHQILGDTALYRSVTRSECHSYIAASLPSACGTSKGKYLAEKDKRDIAISFTACSMRSALQPIPSECSKWSFQDGAAGSIPTVYTFWRWSEVEEDQQRSCLSALHRSPQDWTSYNGFLSDASQLCHALRGEHDNELVRQLYVNATSGQMSFLNKLDLQSEARENRDAKFEAVLSDQQSKLEHTASVMHSTAEAVQYSLLQHEHLSKLLHSCVSDIQVGKRDLLETLELAIRTQTESTTSFVETYLARTEIQLRDQLSGQLDDILNKHEVDLRHQYEHAGAMMLAIQEEVHHRTVALAEQQASHYETMASSWGTLLQFVGQVEDGLQAMNGNVLEMEEALGHSLQLALHTNTLHVDNAASLALSSQRLENLAAGLDRTSEKLTLLDEKLEARIRSWTSILKRWGARVSLISGPSILSVSRDHDWVLGFVIRAMIAFLELSWQLVCYLLSAACCLLVLPRTSLRAPFSRFLENATTNSGLGEDTESIIGTPMTPTRPPDVGLSSPPSYKSVYSNQAWASPRLAFAPVEKRAPFRPRIIEHELKKQFDRARSAPL
ncbi:hypothetical protein, variant 2 [Cryptococcus amylolentus CBS 6039]|uniref:Nuclear fusion protein KAR5 n=2 Tax=Cryptococcus amylolentus CBS 6039 TaxID=1295533 RepID=A0A1E3HSY3_9TREE|nr:hypothetical protein, variant 1 [Cryptococcus amylolentus CBS 6039]XP_018994270.1 hypothetical protein, variant 2 [Cryptococcus amylolentus CBS 6039]ODN79422.1 hypothetical protein, variant 1 [Cryptococcus amylolentus CBS 6039]ODN79423.1 hypothetical protein, variant 2 [Cryptococcus amylolentus CBS 6039]